MSKIDLFQGKGVQVRLANPDDFLKVRETLTRIGIASKQQKKLFQSCHILHKQGEYAIVHFKELFALDGKQTEITEDDIGRRNTVASLLDDWGLVRIINPEGIDEPRAPLRTIKIVPFSEKKSWELVQKYSIGKPH